PRPKNRSATHILLLFPAWWAMPTLPDSHLFCPKEAPMISQKKLQANRRNAQKSTGPKTPEGKAVSSQNGLTHGLTSRKFPILPGEDEAAYQEFHEAMVLDLKPRGVMQREIVDDIVLIRWKLRRVPHIEAEMMRRNQAHVETNFQIQ